MCANGNKWVLNTILFANDTVLIEENQWTTQPGKFV